MTSRKLRFLIYSIAGLISGVLVFMIFLKHEPKDNYLEKFAPFSIGRVKQYATPLAYSLDVTLKFNDFRGQTAKAYHDNQGKELFLLNYFHAFAEAKDVEFRLVESNINEPRIPQQDILKINLSGPSRARVLEIYQLLETLGNYYNQEQVLDSKEIASE